MGSTTTHSRAGNLGSTAVAPPLQEARGATSPPISGLVDSYARSLRASNRSPATIDRVYLPALLSLETFLRDELGHSTRVGAIRREHVESFLVALRERPGRKGQPMSAATVSKVYRALRPFFGWLLEEDEIETDPMARIPRPRVEEKHKTPLTEHDLERILATCSGKTFEERRDTAIIRLLGSTGIRRGELEGLTVESVELGRDGGRAYVEPRTSKSRRGRFVAFGPKTATAIDRYLRMRAGHPLAEHRDRRGMRPLWLGTRGREALAGGAFLLMLRRRGRAAGIPDLHPHLFRHTFAHRWLERGGSEGDLMQQTGWKDRSMIGHYSGALAAERAQEAARRLDPMEDV
jgi:integrase